jgi:hypothetical protein
MGGRRIAYRTATANSTARIAAPIASGQKLSLGELFTGLYCRTLKPEPGRPALTYRGSRIGPRLSAGLIFRRRKACGTFWLLPT